MKHENLILLILVIILLVAPFVMYSGLGEDQGFFGGADDQGSDAVSEIGYHPWFESLWEPPSGEVESLLFAVQAAIGAIIIGYAFGYWKGIASTKKQEKD
ncbi:cobalt ABC transporter substrate-binding protein CbiN [Methanobrevibacter sp. 87.7]|uniref:energy-coupling factor ABC transporter substrate-binding protein n=1 Tax=Methanobrevibacter sp. 87.7 TaxID=387957 RepID=UPI000B50C892|nr:energy-coupling factor ABC transporter substrate-binding protein [Methanobrevibacter sp. 87.7]OWT32361.1 cobalt ABC transporter substrate-binding protein CbiN [Methanobrevibacter sp. 87.7]